VVPNLPTDYDELRFLAPFTPLLLSRNSSVNTAPAS
jgi:hypothetical protein